MNNNQDNNVNNNFNNDLNNNLGGQDFQNSQDSQNAYYNNDAYYNNENYDNNYSDTSYEEPEKKKNIWWKILLAVLLLLIIIIIILKFVGGGETGDEKYTELKAELCAAAESYAEDNSEIIDSTQPGLSTTIKLQKLADANLIEAQILNPYYSNSLFNKSTVDKYYSMNNSIRLTVLTDGTFNCEMVDNSTDVTAPELRLSGDSEITLAVGTEFEDPGYTATDDYDGDITTNVVRSGNVDTTTAGEYVITYTVTDSAGNVTTKIRKIVVEEYADIEITLGSILDSVTPMISLKGSNPYCMVKGTQYVEPGAIATDNVDGDITNRISVVNKVTGNLMGAFRITYKVEDSSGNEAIAYRAVIVTTECPEEDDSDLVANNAPTITLIGKTSVTLKKGTEYLDLGATAYDKEDGDLTSQIITDTTAVNTSSAGVYKVTYRVTDSEGTLTTAVRTVTVKESVSGTPSVKFTSTKSNISVMVGLGNNELISAPKAVNENGVSVAVTTKIEDYTTKVKVSSIDWNTVGKYKVTYTAIHGDGIVKQTKSIVVNIYADGVVIGGNDTITVTKRTANCNLTEADLLSGGVTFTTAESATAIVSITDGDTIACTVGTYSVNVSARTTSSTESKKDITVKVVDGNGTIDVTAPSKTIITGNTASPSDVYNSSGVWVGGSTTGITLTFKSTPADNTEIAYFEYSTDCSTANGRASKTSTTTGTLPWDTEGSTSVCIRAVTTTGATGPWSDIVKLNIDTTGPTIEFTHTWDDGADDWHNSSTLTVTYSAAEESNGSGLDHFEYTFDDVNGVYGDEITNPTTYNEATGSLTVNEDTESSRRHLFVYVRAVDKAGNVGEWTTNPAHTNIDTKKPYTPTLSIEGDGTSLVKLNVNFSDRPSTRASDFGKLIYTVNDGDELTETSQVITAPYNNTDSNISENIKVWAVDRAGNISDSYAETDVVVAPMKVLVTGITLKNGDTVIADGGSCSASTIKVGNVISLTAVPIPTDADDNVVTWYSDNTNIAVVNSSGNVIIKGAGKANITAKIGDYSIYCSISSSANVSDSGSDGTSSCEYTTETACETGEKESCWQSGSCWIPLDDSTYSTLAICQSALKAMSCGTDSSAQCILTDGEYDLRCVSTNTSTSSNTSTEKYTCSHTANVVYSCRANADESISYSSWVVSYTRLLQERCSAFTSDLQMMKCVVDPYGTFTTTMYTRTKLSVPLCPTSYTYDVTSKYCLDTNSSGCGNYTEVSKTYNCSGIGGTIGSGSTYASTRCWLYNQTSDLSNWTCSVG